MIVTVIETTVTIVTIYEYSLSAKFHGLYLESGINISSSSQNCPLKKIIILIFQLRKMETRVLIIFPMLPSNKKDDLAFKLKSG